MAQLQYFPTEILIQILQHVRHVDFRAFLFSQATSRLFRSIVQDMITSVQQSSFSSAHRQEKPCLQPFLQRRFAPLFNTTNAFTAEERAKNVYYYLSLEGDCTLPFRRLPWAQDEAERKIYLRPEASWRRLPLLAGDGGAITQLEIVKNYTTQTSDTVEYLQVELPSPSSSTTMGQLTMGTFYDLLLGEQATYGWETGSWELHLGTRLRNIDLLFEYECYVYNDPELVDLNAPPHCAVLHVLGGSGCDQEFAGVDWETCWKPKVLGQKPPRCLPWQGPLKHIDEGTEVGDDDVDDE
ncbi:hypothetical protein PG993_001546 [Apiospora rasikravindrae]|uniref:F-box domain-containing protein n=1 Tax=Apiospora rasikravindrae TaxID=990691 RepID=A0ABR1UBQ4_9PEZI